MGRRRGGRGKGRREYRTPGEERLAQLSVWDGSPAWVLPSLPSSAAERPFETRLCSDPPYPSHSQGANEDTAGKITHKQQWQSGDRVIVRVRLRDPEGARGERGLLGNGIVLMRSIVVNKRRREAGRRQCGATSGGDSGEGKEVLR